MSLPGLWRYGSRAVACFAFGKRVGIVDANVRRILTRLFALRLPQGKRVHALADAIALAAEDAAEANYGLLDIGALICKRNPCCGECPLAEACKYAEKNHAAMKERAAAFDPSKLAQQRRAKALSQRALAAAVGVSQASIAEFETGKRFPSIDVLGRIAETLAVTEESFRPSRAASTAPMPRSERYLSQAAVKAAEEAFGRTDIRKKEPKTEK